MLRNHLAWSEALIQVEVIKLGEDSHSLAYFRGRFSGSGEASPLEFEHVLVPGATPGAGGNVSAHRSALRNQRGKSSAVTHAEHDHAIYIYEFILAHRCESGAPAGKLGVKVSLRASSLTLANARLVHADGCIAGLIDETKNERAKTIGLAIGVFHAVATEPADEKNDRHFSSSAFWPRDICAQPLAICVRNPSTQDVGVTEVGLRGRG